MNIEINTAKQIKLEGPAGLTDVVLTLFDDGQTQVHSATMTEILSGVYQDIWTPTAAGNYTGRVASVAAGQTVHFDVSVVVPILPILLKYHDNETRFFGPDGTTETTQQNAAFVVVYDDDGITELKRIALQNSSGTTVTLPNATRYVKQ